MPFIDFEALKASVPIEEAAQLLGLDLKQNGSQLRGPCPSCKSSDPRTLVITPSKAVFFCFKAQKGGDVIALAAHIRQENVKEAAAFLAGGFGNPTTSTVPTRTSSPQDSRQSNPPHPRDLGSCGQPNDAFVPPR